MLRIVSIPKVMIFVVMLVSLPLSCASEIVYFDAEGNRISKTEYERRAGRPLQEKRERFIQEKGKKAVGSGILLKAYKRYVKVLKRNDFEKTIQHFSQKSRDEIRELSGRKKSILMEYLTAIVPGQYWVIGEEIKGKTGFLTLKSFGKSRGWVKMVKENGKWKLDEEEWVHSISFFEKDQ